MGGEVECDETLIGWRAEARAGHECERRRAGWPRTAKAVRHNKICGLVAVQPLPRFLRRAWWNSGHSRL